MLDLENGASVIVGTLQNPVNLAVNANTSQGILVDLGTATDGLTTDRASGGSSLTIDGTLTLNGTSSLPGGLEIGVSGGVGVDLVHPSTVTANAIINNGALISLGQLEGLNSNQSTLDILGPAGFGPAGTTGELTGDVGLAANSLIEFASGQINTIAANSLLELEYNTSFIADSSNPTANSALTGLQTIAGNLILNDGSVIQTSGDLTITGTGLVQLDYQDLVVVNGVPNSPVNYTSNGCTLAVGGGLTIESGGELDIGYLSGTFFQTSPSVTANNLNNAGTIYLTSLDLYAS